ncbi:MAG: NUDIX hydrolase [Lentisphaeria bacterium]|nr:NUDIX hydrolase [Lentisphaeria bacterium]
MEVEILSKKDLGGGKFVKLEEICYRDAFGVCRTWEKCARVNSRGAVIIIPEIVPDGVYLMVRQYRVPAEKYVIEFPAGLVDDGESAEATALRELYEETGYEGKITQVFPAGFSSPGMSGEEATIVKVEIDGDKYRGKKVENHQEASENIEVIHVKKSEFQKFVYDRIQAGDGVDNKLFMLMI